LHPSFSLAHVDVQLYKLVGMLVETWTGFGEERVAKIRRRDDGKGQN